MFTNNSIQITTTTKSIYCKKNQAKRNEKQEGKK